ncbi:hypothetical protein B9G69_012480 [Bdellovibrio sp. SKB1291214]|uniref:hypothetical protein n=1 Tax=Bdellovibrio sp. SKB1291214 TaxID=1732569 RepID=UPI000B516474|nr:hypothetical protein [Bdellovibrio sp. SKB1291214]UYL07862.1 hypothetical protein B9G69_012480 [Bdellovibrio sp. SKB1291214]
MIVLACLQIGYFLITGVWPLIHRRSFEATTGPKVDWWLVQMVGLLTVVIAIVLVYGLRQEDYFLVRLIGMASADAFIIIDLSYALKGRISKIYIADAFIQFLFCLGYLIL